MNGGNNHLVTVSQMGRVFTHLWTTYITPLLGDVGSIKTSLGGGVITNLTADDANEGIVVTKTTISAGEDE